MAKMSTMKTRANTGKGRNTRPADSNKTSGESMGSMTQSPTNDGRPPKSS